VTHIAQFNHKWYHNCKDKYSKVDLRKKLEYFSAFFY